MSGILAASTGWDALKAFVIFLGVALIIHGWPGRDAE